jgi:hypothetical protein
VGKKNHKIKDLGQKKTQAEAWVIFGGAEITYRPQQVA